MRASANAKQHTLRAGWRGGPSIADGVATDGKKIDIWLSYLPTDRAFAMEVAMGLMALGYTCALCDAYDHGDAGYRNITANDARYVIVLWTPPAQDAPQIKADARSAAMRGALIEIAFRKGCPTERFSDDALISFKRTENLTTTDQWRALRARIVPRCGEPYRPVREVAQEAARHAPAFGLVSLAIGMGGAAMLFGGAQQDRQQAVQDLVEPESQASEAQYLAPVKRVSATPTVDLALVMGSGGPEKDFISLDEGTAPKGLAPASAPEQKSAPTPRSVQGPEE